MIGAGQGGRMLSLLPFTQFCSYQAEETEENDLTTRLPFYGRNNAHASDESIA